MTNVTSLHFSKENIAFTGFLTPEAAKFIDKFVALNQHQGGWGKMDREKLVSMLLSDVVDAMRNGDTWTGGHMALVMSMHGYRTS